MRRIPATKRSQYAVKEARGAGAGGYGLHDCLAPARSLENSDDERVSYGLTSLDEICNIAIVFTPFSTTDACEVVQTSDGVSASG